MGRYTGRLLFALILSSSGYYGTTYWYNTQKTSQFGQNLASRQPIALLQEALQGVQKKSSQKIIWEDVSKDESLFSGESIRTSPSSEAKILFLKSNNVIELEPDSLIVLEESPKGLTLNFLKGNVFIKKGKKALNSGGDSQALVLKTGNNVIDVKNSSLSLSKSKTGSVDLDVFEGSASVKGKDGQVKELDKTKSGTLSNEGSLNVTQETIQILSPSPDHPVYIDPTQNQKLHIKWKKLNKNYNIKIVSGRRRSRMKPNDKLKVSGEIGEVLLKSKLGKFYWQLMAEPKKGVNLPIIKSKVLPLEIIAKIPPKLIFPKNKDKIVLQSESPNIQMKWTNQSRLERMFLEVSKDPKMKTKIFETTVDTKKTSFDFEIRNQGIYYWRVTGYMKIKDKFEGLSSPIQSFQIGVIEELNPPTLIYPELGQKLSHKQYLKNGLLLKWTPEKNAIQYKIKFLKAQDKNSKKSIKNNEQIFITESTQYYLKGLDPGWYYWSVASVNKTKKESPYTKPQTFKIFDIPKILWSGGTQYQDYLYITQKPSFHVKWTPPSELKVKFYRIKYALEDRFSQQKKWYQSQFSEYKQYLPHDGSYSFLVEAISFENKIIARSDVKTIYVKEQKRLPAPIYQTQVPQVIQSNRSGDFAVQWEPVQGAKEYLVQLRTKNGDIIRQKKYSSTQGSWSGLNPGEYKITLVTIDKHNRPGPIGSEKLVQVPKISNIKAPSLKGIKIK